MLLVAIVVSTVAIGVSAAAPALARMPHPIQLGLAVGLCVGLLLSGGAAPARGATDLGAQLMRVTNLDRVALGYPALAIDPTLVGLAGDAPFPCPSDRSMVLAGRATDMARRGYFSHAIAGCADAAGVDYTILDVLASEYGYDTLRAENIGEWSGNPSASASYRSGCDVGGANCVGGTTSVSVAVAWVERAFMNSSDHRGTILGSYDRFGCGAAQARSGQTDFVCLFSLGGPAIPDPPPPTIVSVSGSHATYVPGRPRLFTALVEDAACLVSASASLDGTPLAIWHYPHGGHTSTLHLLIAPAHLLPGPHRLVWQVVDAAGSTAARGVAFTVR